MHFATSKTTFSQPLINKKNCLTKLEDIQKKPEAWLLPDVIPAKNSSSE